MVKIIRRQQYEYNISLVSLFFKLFNNRPAAIREFSQNDRGWKAQCILQIIFKLYTSQRIMSMDNKYVCISFIFLRLCRF